MAQNYYGAQEVTDEDRAYKGSRFSEVREAIFANPYQSVWGREGEPPLPLYKTPVSSTLRGVLPFGKRYLFGDAVKRTVDSHADLRWGRDRKGFRRIIHPNGACLTGLWEITEHNEYSGYFKEGSRGLVVARYSTCCAEVRRGELRDLALAGKLYPTTDPDHAEPLRTASFFVSEDIAGEYTDYVNDAVLLSAPNVTISRRPIGMAIVGAVFAIVDIKASMRQLYQIAELGKAPHEPTRAPEFMRLSVSSEAPRLEGENMDFRDEIMGQIFDRGDPAPKRELTFDVEVTDEGETHLGLGGVRRTFRNWRRIGRLTFDNAVVSYNGDFVIHFNHPGWRYDRNDPATAHRAGLTSAC